MIYNHFLLVLMFFILFLFIIIFLLLLIFSLTWRDKVVKREAKPTWYMGKEYSDFPLVLVKEWIEKDKYCYFNLMKFPQDKKASSNIEIIFSFAFPFYSRFPLAFSFFLFLVNPLAFSSLPFRVLLIILLVNLLCQLACPH